MPISVNPTVPVDRRPGVPRPTVVLQPGTVVDAQVLKILADNLVRIAIANLSIDVLSEVPLQAGQNLQLAVSQTRRRRPARGGRAGRRRGDRQRTCGYRYSRAGATLASAARCIPGECRRGRRIRPRRAASINALTPLEQLGRLTAACRPRRPSREAWRRCSPISASSPSSGGLPPALQQAVAQVLAQRTSLDQNLTGGDVKNAFQSSGLFLEASLASGSCFDRVRHSRSQGRVDRACARRCCRRSAPRIAAATTATAPPQSAARRCSPMPPPSNESPPCRMPRLCQRRLRHRCLPKSKRRKFFCRRHASRSAKTSAG